MTISKDIFLAILAMDSYNRGYGAGVADEREGDTNGLGDSTGIRIGSATVRSRADSGVSPEAYQAWQDAGFYALAYDIGGDGPEGLAGKTVISYRGTDTSLDRSTGWSVGAGNIDDWTQAPLALEFYNGWSTKPGC